MERNKDDAGRALEAAKMKFGEGNFAAAKKIMLEAESVVSTLEGSQMLEVLKVHAAAESKLGDSEMDWYGILGVNPEADTSMINTQYRRRARLVHPDKNKGVGAEAAVKLLTEAHSILSDEAKRALHDMKRGVRANPLQPYPSRSSETYQTACPNCKRVYPRTYENYPVPCPNCNEQFSAREFHDRAAGRGADGSREPKETEKEKRGKETGHLREGIKRPVTKRKKSVAMLDKMRKKRTKASKTNGDEQRRNTLNAMRTKPAPSAEAKAKAETEDEEKFREEFGGGSGGQHNENGAKAQSVPDDSSNVNWRSVGARGGTLRERYKGGYPMGAKKGSHNSNFTNSGSKSPTTCNDSTAELRVGKGFIPRQPDCNRFHFAWNRRQQHTGGKECFPRQFDSDRFHFVSNRRQQLTTTVLVFFF